MKAPRSTKQVAHLQHGTGRKMSSPPLSREMSKPQIGGQVNGRSTS